MTLNGTKITDFKKNLISTMTFYSYQWICTNRSCRRGPNWLCRWAINSERTLWQFNFSSSLKCLYYSDAICKGIDSVLGTCVWPIFRGFHKNKCLYIAKFWHIHYFTHPLHLQTLQISCFLCLLFWFLFQPTHPFLGHSFDCFCLFWLSLDDKIMDSQGDSRNLKDHFGPLF